MGRWGRNRVMEGATAVAPAARRGLSTHQLTTTIAALQYVYDRTHAHDSAPAVARSPGWSFLSDHARVLVCLAETPDRPLRDVAAAAAVAEPVAPHIVADLLAGGYIRRISGPGPARYEVDRARPLHHPAERGSCVGDLLAAWSPVRPA